MQIPLKVPNVSMKNFSGTTMLLLIIMFLFSLSKSCTADKDTIPVFMMDADKVMSHLKIPPNPFAKLPVSFFTNIIHEAMKLSDCVIIFVEDKLSSEDLSLKDKLGSPYHHMRQGVLDKKVKYIPSAAEPYKILMNNFHLQPNNVFYLSLGVKPQLLDALKYLYIFFQDNKSDTRAHILRTHDVIMHEVYSTIRQMKKGPVIAFYTGRMNPIIVEKLEFIPIKPKSVPKDMGVMLITEGALFRFSGVYATSALRRAPCNQMPLVAEETWSRRKLSTTMAYTDFELQFNFSFQEDGWLLDNVALIEGGEEVGRTDMGVGAPWKWSFICGEPLSILNTRDGSAVTISQYQIQPIHPRQTRRQDGGEGEESGGEGGGEGGGESGGDKGGGPVGDDTKCFGKTVNCGPYFNTNILSGLFVSFICLAITSYGVLMLYNCGSNDKFDDPHGKEVIFSTEH